MSLLAKSNKEWADMTAEERKVSTQEGKAQAIALVEKDKMPTGLKVTVGGIEYIARPVRVTGSGGVTYNIAPRPTRLGRHSARFNKFSFTLLGEGSGDSDMAFEEENLA